MKNTTNAAITAIAIARATHLVTCAIAAAANRTAWVKGKKVAAPGPVTMAHKATLRDNFQGELSTAAFEQIADVLRQHAADDGVTESSDDATQEALFVEAEALYKSVGLAEVERLLSQA